MPAACIVCLRAMQCVKCACVLCSTYSVPVCYAACIVCLRDMLHVKCAYMLCSAYSVTACYAACSLPSSHIVCVRTGSSHI